MSENVGQLFKDWMVASGKSKNTASNYFSGVNTVSDHSRRDLLAIDDPDELERLYRLYGPNGKYAGIGGSNSNNVHSGLRQWLAYNRYRTSEPSIDPQEGRQQWDKFLARWPVSKLRELTLEQYYGSEGDDTFYSWMRDHTNKLGDFKEGLMSAGVRLRGANPKNDPGSDMQSDGQYLWYRILGDSAQQALDNLKAELLTAIDAVQQGDLGLMSGLKNAPGSLVWKVAFLYQNRSQPLVLPFFNQKQLKRILGAGATGGVRELQQQLMARRGEKDVLEFAAELEREALKGQNKQCEQRSSSMKKSATALNQILFGPPGTGKTYATVEAALEVLDSDFLQAHRENRSALKRRFDEFAQQDRIRFVTFHQSFSYEDFVEGIRAQSTQDGLKYNVESGVFKRLCEDARGVNVDQIIQQFLEEIASKPLSLSTPKGKSFVVSYQEGNETISCLPAATSTNNPLPANIDQVRQILTGQTPKRIYCESYVRGIANYLKPKLPAETLGDNYKNPYVLIIDEINRGNVSRIFGELITLIEPSKRRGAEEALTVTLPYSSDPFSVPKNVYLIGTMNTADRSLAGLDIALRRRFVFREMPPRPDLLKGVMVEQAIDMEQLLRVMNRRIEVLLDRDHCLGHAYFMPLKGDGSLDRLAVIFRNQILPLLQEYFFEDWERISWVLNDQQAGTNGTAPFIQRPKSEQSLASLFGSQVAEKLSDQRWELNDVAFASLASYQNILG